MNLEQFKLLDGESFTASSSSEKGKAPMEVLAGKLIADGQRGIADYERSRVERNYGYLIVDQSFINGLQTTHQINMGAIGLGTGILALQSALVEGEFSAREFHHFWNAVNRDFFYLQDQPEPEDHVERFTPLKWRRMLAHAKEDPSLTSFFSDLYYQLLPIKLTEFMETNGLVSALDRAKPVFKRKYQELVHFQAPGSDEFLERVQKLGDFDAFYATLHNSMMEKKFGHVLAKQEQEINEEQARQLLPEVHMPIFPPGINLDTF